MEHLLLHTSRLSYAHLEELRLTRHACAHPRIGPLTQEQLERALVTAYTAIPQLCR